MKKIILSLLFLLSFSWCCACDTEKILRFDVLTQISADSSVTVRERIIVCSTSKEIKQGIYRTLAKKGPARYEILSVSRDGQKEEFSKKSIDIDNLQNAKILPYIYNMEEIMNVANVIVAM